MSAPLFVAANLLAGVFNYLFQAIAGTRLTAENFAALNSWLAHVSIFFFIGGIFQYLALFGSIRRTTMRALIVGSSLGLAGLSALWLKTADDLDVNKAMMLLAGALMYGWLLGAAQRRMFFTAMALSSLVVGLAKILLLFFPVGNAGLSNYAFAMFAGYLPAFLILSFAVWRSPGDSKSAFDQITWNRTLILSLATAAFPQLDLILFHHTQAPALFAEFVRASLYFKAIYFIVFIFAQWLLPHQLNQTKPVSKGWAARTVLGLGILMSAALAATTPWTAKLLFGWEEPPPLTLTFLSCMTGVMFAWLFILLQTACAQQNLSAAWRALLIVIAGSALQYTLAPPGLFYFVIALGTSGVAVMSLSLRQGAANVQ